MADDSQAFLFNVEEFFGSVAAQRMSFAEKGVYLVMLFQQWRAKERSLPDSPEGVAELIAVTPDQASEVEAAWTAVRRKFVTSKHTQGRIYNVKLEETRRAQRAYFKRRSVAGQKGGEARARKLRQAKEIDPVANVAMPHFDKANSGNAQAKRSDQLSVVKSSSVQSRSGVFAGSLPRDHVNHAICGRVCLHNNHLARLAHKLGGDSADARVSVLAWAKGVADAWMKPPLDTKPIGENDFAFWDARFVEWQPATGTSKASEQDAAFAAALRKGPSVRP